MGDFDMIASYPILSQFLETYGLSSLNIDPACFKNSKNTSQSFAYKFQTEFDEFEDLYQRVLKLVFLIIK